MMNIFDRQTFQFCIGHNGLEIAVLNLDGSIAVVARLLNQSQSEWDRNTLCIGPTKTFRAVSPE